MNRTNACESDDLGPSWSCQSLEVVNETGYPPLAMKPKGNVLTDEGRKKVLLFTKTKA